MAKFMTVSEYVEHSGLSEDLVRRLTNCHKKDEFSFRSSRATNAPIHIDWERLDRMLIEDEELREVL